MMTRPIVLARLAVALACGPAATGQAAVPGSGLPGLLSQTGLYADISTQTIATDYLPYTPQYPLWSDGASKRRWVHLPAGSSIDASDPDHWIFPAGTRLFKEFSLGRRVETRILQRNADQTWSFGAYVWDEGQTDARLAPEQGLQAVAEVQPGVPWDVPGRYDCLACHADPTSPVLGFERLQLSSDRDPLALHAEGAAGIDLDQLVERGWIRNLPPDRAPFHLTAATPQERALRGYLHANCGGCHNARSPLADVGLFLDRTSSLDLRDPRILERISTRDPLRQMPPLGTRLVDADASSLLEAWMATSPLTVSNSH